MTHRRDRTDEVLARTDFLAALLDQTARDLHGRMGRGFLALRQGALKVEPSKPATLPQPDLRPLLAAHQEQLQAFLTKHIPGQIERLYRRGRFLYRLGLSFLILALVTLAVSSFLTYRAIEARTPTRYQLELMIQGLEAQGGTHAGRQ